jgi:serine/threonine protein kinase
MHPTGGRTRGVGLSVLRPLAPIDANRNSCMQQSSQRKGNTPKKVSIAEKPGSSGVAEASKIEPYTPTVIEETRKTPDGKVTAHRYLRGKMLGKGGFAKVYLCTAVDTNKNYAIKIVPKANLVKARARQKVRHTKPIECVYLFRWKSSNIDPFPHSILNSFKLRSRFIAR